MIATLQGKGRQGHGEGLPGQDDGAFQGATDAADPPASGHRAGGGSPENRLDVVAGEGSGLVRASRGAHGAPARSWKVFADCPFFGRRLSLAEVRIRRRPGVDRPASLFSFSR